MRRASAIGALALLACAARLVPAVVPAPPAVVSMDASAAMVMEDASAPSRCPNVARRPKTPQKTDSCASLREDAVAFVDKALTKKFEQTTKPHKLIIDYGCDTLDGEVRDIDFETGSGHGGGLTLYHLTRTGARFDVRAIAYDEYCHMRTSTCGLTLAQGEIDARKIDAAMETIRVALLARMHDVLLYRNDNSIGLGSFSTSSADIHLAIKLADNVGHFIARSFTGYMSSYHQEDRLPLEVASEVFNTAFNSLTFKKAPPTLADRSLFADRFADAWDEKEPEWWVAERMIGMAKDLGTIEQLPVLLSMLEPEDGDVGAQRRRDSAIDAIAAITAFDLRKDESGDARPPGEVAADYLRECRRGR